MAGDAATIAGMPRKKRPASGSSPGQGRSPAYTLFARIHPDLGQAWEQYLASLRPKPTAVSAIEVVLEEFLKAQGFWPLSSKGGTP
jgi:hypothetical protein